MSPTPSADAQAWMQARLSEGIDRIARATPVSDPGPFDPNLRPTAGNHATRPSPRILGAALAAAAAMVAVVVGMALATSGGDPQPADRPSTDTGGVLSDTTVFETIVPPNGPEPRVFLGGVSAADASDGQPALADGRVSLTFSPGGSDDQICYVIEQMSTPAHGCMRVADIQTGLETLVARSDDGTVDVTGIVPDDVGTVRIGDDTIHVVNNVWHHVGHDGDDFSFEVTSVDGTLTASTG